MTVIDSSAFDHLIFDSSQVSPTKPSSQRFVSTINDTSNPVSGEGSLPLTDILSLDYVLLFPL